MPHARQKNAIGRERTELFAPSGMPLDRIDATILRQLQHDSRVSAQSIADRTGLSNSGALSRLHRLEQTGVIRRFTIEIDEIVFESWPTILVELSLTKSGRRAHSEVQAAINAQPEIIEATEVIGDYCYLLSVALPSPAHWTSVQWRLDPTATLIRKALPRLVGRKLKRSGLHPLLCQVASVPNQGD
jgi:DNA-binding Lrp family transcriptional regulator